MSRFSGFEPVFNEKSRVLILGSFPSVKSRSEGFYYGNPQNRFWRMLSSFFGVGLPQTVEEKRALLLERGVALWDMVASCEIEGSSDASIRGERVADVRTILGHAPVECVLCNGTKAYELFVASAGEYLSIARKMPSTSPANPRYREEIWHEVLAQVFACPPVGKMAR